MHGRTDVGWPNNTEPIDAVPILKDLSVVNSLITLVLFLQEVNEVLT